MLAAVAAYLPLAETWERRTLDLRTRGFADPRHADPRIVAVVIDQKSLDAIAAPRARGGLEQGWPWPRDYYAAVLRYLIAAGARLCDITGSSRALLTAERTALNFLQLLSAVATATRRYVDRVAGTRAAILDTRKTLPGLRIAQKYAVTVGGGRNHRMGLWDAILIKENHIAAAGGIRPALAAARLAKQALWIQIEVETLDQLREAVTAGATLVLLDNMTPDQMREAVAWTAGRAQLEASGGITLDNVRGIAETGVDRISIGALTKDVAAIDLSLRFSLQP